MRSIDELIDQNEPALPLLRTWLDDPAGNGGILLQPSDAVRTDTLLRLQVTTRSMLGAVAYETGGLLVANGLVRLLGSGVGRSLRSAAKAAGHPLDGSYPDVLVIGDDVLGGLFALNGGRFGLDEMGQVFHLAADDTAWIGLGAGYIDFVSWCLTSDLADFYGPLADLDAYKARPRPGFEASYAFYPFLWTAEAKIGGPDARVIPAEESLKLRLDLLGFSID